MSSIINNKYRIIRRIGGGSFGDIYMGIGPSNEKVAIKFERQGSRCPQLRHEYKVYRELYKCNGFCQVYHFGVQENYNVMVMDLLGPSLEDLFNKCNRRFSLKTVIQIADQMLEHVDTLHSRHLIHRDIKPANFVIGLGENSGNIYCVDFGLSKRFRHPKTMQHIPHRDGRSLTGTPRYASINNHLGIEQSRRDDLESIAYVLIYFLKGSLPWQGLKAKNAPKKYRLILEKKQQVSIAQLCQGCPSQFAEFLAYTRSMKFDSKPDIPYLRKLFRDLYMSQGYGSTIGKQFDWDNLDLDYPATASAAGEGESQRGADPVPMVLNFYSSSGGAPAGQARPNTAAAVNMDGDLYMNDDFGDDLYAGNGAGNTSSRPSTANNSAARPASGNAIAGGVSMLRYGAGAAAPPQPEMAPFGGMVKPGYGGANMGTTAADMQRARPHTAHVSGRAAQPGAVGTAQYGAVNDGRNGVMAPGQEVDEDGEDHVVIGARAMMRYRRTRAPTTDSNASGTNSNPQLVSNAPAPSAGGAGYSAFGASKKILYPSAPAGWVGGPSTSAVEQGARPKSAAATSAHMGGMPAYGQSATNTLSYGAVKKPPAPSAAAPSYPSTYGMHGQVNYMAGYPQSSVPSSGQMKPSSAVASNQAQQQQQQLKQSKLYGMNR